MRRRDFFAATSAAVLTPAGGVLSQQSGGGKLRISAVEFWQMQGRRETVSGINNQYQVNPIHVYDDERPQPYHETGPGKPGMASVSALYLKIKTDAGLEGFYGPIDREAAIVVDQQLRRFLIGKDPLAGETLWDQMHRSNRHSRSGHFMMAISAVDNTLWDLRGRYFNAPVYRLLGGPTRAAVEAYVSCLGYSVEPEPARAKAVDFKNQGFRFQKWFMAYGPGDGPAGLTKNVELVRVLREAVGEEVDLAFDDDDDMLTAMARELVTQNRVGERADNVWRQLQRQTPAIATPVEVPLPAPEMVLPAVAPVASPSAHVALADFALPVKKIARRPLPGPDENQLSLAF